MDQTPFRLRVIEGPLLGREFPLPDRETVRLGRREGCEVRLDDPAVSGYHCRLLRSGAGWRLEDLGSSNGTTLNGAAVQEAELRHRDLLVVGDSVIQFLSTDSRTADTTASLVRDEWTRQDSDIVEQFPCDLELPSIPGHVLAAGVGRLQSALQACYQLAGLINEVERLDQHFHRMLSIISQAYQADRGCLVLIVPDGGYEIACTVQHLHGARQPFEVSRTILDSCVLEGNSILTLGQAAMELFDASESLQMQQVQAILCVPVGTRTAGRIGAVYLDSLSHVGLFDRQDLLLLTCLANLLGGAIDRHRLGQEALRDRRQIEAINEAMTAFIGQAGLADASRILLERGLDQTGSRAGFVGIAGEDRELLCLAQRDFLAVAGEPPWSVPQPGRALREVLAGGPPLLASQLDGVPPEDLPEGVLELENLLAVPLSGAGAPIGLFVLANRPGGFRAAERDSLQVLAGMAGVIYESHLRRQHEATLQEQFRQSQKMEAIGRLAGGVAHDFNNMLTVINGYCDLLLERLAPADPLAPDIAEIRKCSRRSVELTRQLLSLSRKQAVEPRVLELDAVLADMEKMLRRLIGEDVELQIVGQVGLHPVYADPGQLQQVLMNLAVNARDAMPRGGRLRIEAGNVTLDAAATATRVGLAPGEHLRLAVSDTGGGMDAETLSRIFEPFFTTKALGAGTGLGLSTVYGIVQQCGGHIDVTSAPDRGTTFEILLPRCSGGQEPSAAPRGPGPSAAGGETILLVEDEEPVRRLTARVLGMHGYRVLEAAGGGDALLVLERHTDPIDLLLTDVVMPQMSGPELAQRLTALRPQTKLLYMSAYPDAEVARHSLAGAEAPFLQKPFEAEGLLRKVREALDR